MLPRSTAAVVLVAALALAAAACGSGSSTGGTTTRGSSTQRAAQSPSLPDPTRFLSVDAGARSVTITLVASYDGANNGFNFDGYSRELMWTVPRGWTVHVVCKNRGPLRHSCAVVDGAGTTQLSFPHASTPQPTVGVEAGHSADFAFRATRTGVYRFVCLVPGHEAADMWDVLKVVRGGKPSAVSLLSR